MRVKYLHAMKESEVHEVHVNEYKTISLLRLTDVGIRDCNEVKQDLIVIFSNYCKARFILHLGDSKQVQNFFNATSY